MMLNGNTRKNYKKRMCRYSNKGCCKYEKNFYLCKFAHNKEELKKKPIYADMGQLKDFSIGFNNPLVVNTNKYNNIICVVIDKLLNKNKIYANVSCNSYNLIMSFLDIKVCNWCCKTFYVKDDIRISRIHSNVKELNSKFIDEEYRYNNPLGTLCIECAMFKIPIQCDICNIYTNSKSISINYSLKDDIEIYDLITHCPHQWLGTSHTESIYNEKKNICYSCMLFYYESIMSKSGFCSSYCDCVDKYTGILDFRYGKRCFNRY